MTNNKTSLSHLKIKSFINAALKESCMSSSGILQLCIICYSQIVQVVNTLNIQLPWWRLVQFVRCTKSTEYKYFEPKIRHVTTYIASYGNWICNQCLSQLTLCVRIPLMVRCARYNIMWWSLSVTYDRSMVFYTNKTDHHDITEILLMVALSPNCQQIQHKYKRVIE
jgi:hypothetical protein